MTLEEIDRRRSYESMFDMMEQVREQHPDWDDDQLYEHVCFHVIPDRIAAQVDQMKERRREC
jgi:hypothetical protein